MVVARAPDMSLRKLQELVSARQRLASEYDREAVTDGRSQHEPDIASTSGCFEISASTTTRFTLARGSASVSELLACSANIESHAR